MMRTMRPLELDFGRSRGKAPWAGWALLALAALFVLDLGQGYHEARTAQAEAEARLARVTRTADSGRPGARPRAATPEEIAAARDTYHRLAMPWDRLFGALEAAATDRVILVAIEPDAKSGTVTISGEGKDYPAVLDYIVRLREAPTLSGAHLVKHEARQNGPQMSVAFSVAAAWGDVKRDEQRGEVRR
jgi:hypothetical protein